MKMRLLYATSFLVALSLFLTLPLVSQNVGAAANSQEHSASRKVKVKIGTEAVKRVEALKRNNKNLRVALSLFEKKGHNPKMKDSVVITDTLSQSDITFLRRQKGTNQAVVRKTAFRAQESVGSPEGEIVFIPTLNINGEWHGTITVIAYDEYGNFVNDYTANVVLVQIPGTNDWETKYEVGVDGGVQYLSWEEGMYTGFDLGYTHPKPTSSSNHVG